jgi:hypothetical protein
MDRPVIVIDNRYEETWDRIFPQNICGEEQDRKVVQGVERQD